MNPQDIKDSWNNNTLNVEKWHELSEDKKLEYAIDYVFKKTTYISQRFTTPLTKEK